MACERSMFIHQYSANNFRCLLFEILYSARLKREAKLKKSKLKSYLSDRTSVNIFIDTLFSHAKMLKVFLGHCCGNRDRKSTGARVTVHTQNRVNAKQRGKRALYGTALYTRRCIRIRVTCTTEHDLSREFTVPGASRRQM